MSRKRNLVCFIVGTCGGINIRDTTIFKDRTLTLTGTKLYATLEASIY